METSVVMIPKRKLKPKVILAIISILIVVLISSFMNNVIGADSYEKATYLQEIQNSSLDECTYTFKEAFDKHFDGEWIIEENENGGYTVDFFGTGPEGAFFAQWTITILHDSYYRWEITYCQYDNINLLDTAGGNEILFDLLN